MENKGDIKAIMARFQTSGSSTDESSSTVPGRAKPPLHPTLSGPSIQTKKPVLESLSAANAHPKPPFLKNTVSSKSDTAGHEPNMTKSLASRFANAQDDSTSNSKPSVAIKKPPFSQPPENKGPGMKPPLNNKSSLSPSLSDSKPTIPKAPPMVSSKPSWAREETGVGSSSTISSTPKVPPLKPTSSFGKLRQQTEEQTGANTDSANKPPFLTNSAVKPIANLKSAQHMFNKEKDKSEQSDSGGGGSGGGGGINKQPVSTSNSIFPPKPPASKKPSLKKPSKPGSPQPSTVNGDATSGPKRNPLPNSLALGPAPAKPNRPPRVNLEQFRRGAEASDEGPGTFKKPITSTTQSSNHSNHVAPTPPPQSALPSLPPRHPGPMAQQEEVYDDVDDLNNCPPPLPSTAGHPSQRAKEEILDDDDGEMYEDLDERWEAAEQKQEKKKEKDEKEEKKRLEAERKEQKEREKKEQDARKKFKLVGPLEVIHQGKARVDCKGNKTDLGLKQGDCLDIIRVQGNPEGKWLGRTQDGSIGYVKTTSVEIDFNSLKRAQQTYEPEVYDDIDVVPDNSGMKGPGVVLPPLPGGEGGEIYDDVVDPNLEVRVPPPSQFTADGNSDKQGAVDEEIYDDVDSQQMSSPPPASGFQMLKGKGKTEDIDPKKQKKFEKEEKDFRKKFKYDGEIKVVDQVTIVQTLTNKKWSGKELPIKAGEKLDVIVKADKDNKLICRNEDGKFGYVSTTYVVTDDGDIYDDIGDDCIYDND